LLFWRFLFLQGGLSRDYISSPSSTAFPVPSLQVLLVFTWDTSKEFDNKFLHLFNASEKEYKFISFLNVILRIKYLSTYLFIMIWFLLQPLLIIKFLTTFFYHTVNFYYWCICFSNFTPHKMIPFADQWATASTIKPCRGTRSYCCSLLWGFFPKHQCHDSVNQTRQ
jgi:hypothetical protein